MRTESVQRVISQTKDEIENLQKALADGNVRDFHEYKLVVGSIRGMATVMGFLSDAVNRDLRGEDMDD